MGTPSDPWATPTMTSPPGPLVMKKHNGNGPKWERACTSLGREAVGGTERLALGTRQEATGPRPPRNMGSSPYAGDPRTPNACMKQTPNDQAGTTGPQAATSNTFSSLLGMEVSFEVRGGREEGGQRGK